MDSKDDEDEDKGSKEDKVGHLVEALLERSLFVAVDVHEGGSNLSDLSLHSSVGNNTLGATLDDGGRGKDHIETVTEGLVGAIDVLQVLLDGEGLSSKKSLVGLEVEDLKEPAVGTDDIAVLKDHDVARDSLVVRDGGASLIADDLGSGGGHVAEGLHGLLGVELLPESDGCVHDNNEENNSSLSVISRCKRQCLFLILNKMIGQVQVRRHQDKYTHNCSVPEIACWGGGK